MHIHTASGTENIYHDTSSQLATCLKCNIATVLLNLVAFHTKKKSNKAFKNSQKPFWTLRYTVSCHI